MLSLLYQLLLALPSLLTIQTLLSLLAVRSHATGSTIGAHTTHSPECTLTALRSLFSIGTGSGSGHY